LFDGNTSAGVFRKAVRRLWAGGVVFLKPARPTGEDQVDRLACAALFVRTLPGRSSGTRQSAGSPESLLDQAQWAKKLDMPEAARDYDGPAGFFSLSVVAYERWLEEVPRSRRLSSTTTSRRTNNRERLRLGRYGCFGLLSGPGLESTIRRGAAACSTRPPDLEAGNRPSDGAPQNREIADGRAGRNRRAGPPR